MSTQLTRRQWLGAAAASAAVPALCAADPPNDGPDRDAVRAALDYLAREHDRFHRHFLIFDDHASGGGHFFPSGWMGDLVTLQGKQAEAVFDERPRGKPAEGANCLRVAYPPAVARGGSEGWVAVAWEGPPDGRGGHVAYDLSRFATLGEKMHLVWLMRGDKGGERGEFKVSRADPQADPLMLPRDWKEFSLDVPRDFLARPLKSCFVWATNRDQNGTGCVFYLDFARLEFGPKGKALRLAEPRFVRSYFPEPTDTPDRHFRNVCFSYDQALAISALVASGRPENLVRAGLLADALVYATRNDRFFSDGRIRNGYLCGDLAGQGRKGPAGPTRLPGWWDFGQRKWLEDAYFAGSDCGNAAWVILGLLNYWQAAGKKAKSPHLEAAVRLGEWVDRNAYREDGPGGFTGGLEGFEPDGAKAPPQKKAPWKSTEHAIDLYAAFFRLAEATGGMRFRQCARHAEKFVEKMWNPKGGHLWTGTKEDGRTPNPEPIPLDVHPWAVLAFRDVKRFGVGLDWAVKNCKVDLGDGLYGFDFDTDKDAAWFEGTGQMALAFRLAGRHDEADACLRAVREKGAVSEPHEARGAIYATSRDKLTTGFMKVFGERQKAEPWVYYRRPHIGASCWYLLAALNYNVYWGEFIGRK